MAGTTSLDARAKKAMQGSATRAAKGAPRSKRPGANDSPSRRTYWASGRLAARKIRNLIRHSGLTRAEAALRWHATRTRFVG